MASEAITIRVSREAARAYEAASEEERRKLDALLSLKLTEVMRVETPLEEVMSDISRKAQERGLTPEALSALLDE
jgi:hypothetical protein